MFILTVGLSVCVFVMTIYCAKMVNVIELPFRVIGLVGQMKEQYIRWGPNPLREGANSWSEMRHTSVTHRENIWCGFSIPAAQ